MQLETAQKIGEQVVKGKMALGKEIGKKDTYGKYVLVTCPLCIRQHWVKGSRLARTRGRCWLCTHWKGGKQKTGGYMGIKLQPDDFFYPMAHRQGVVLEHRLVMAKYLNRCLLSWEVVHHKNGIRDDNRLENLELLPTQRQHLPSMKLRGLLFALERRVKEQGERLTLVEAENALLRGILSKEGYNAVGKS